MEQKDIWDAAAAKSYDTPGTGMFDPALLAATTRRLAELANGGAALEFAIGTGRVAIPLRARGVPVTVSSSAKRWSPNSGQSPKPPAFQW